MSITKQWTDQYGTVHPKGKHLLEMAEIALIGEQYQITVTVRSHADEKGEGGFRRQVFTLKEDAVSGFGTFKGNLEEAVALLLN